jgi:hypothetical protein
MEKKTKKKKTEKENLVSIKNSLKFVLPPPLSRFAGPATQTQNRLNREEALAMPNFRLAPGS